MVVQTVDIDLTLPSYSLETHRCQLEIKGPVCRTYGVVLSDRNKKYYDSWHEPLKVRNTVWGNRPLTYYLSKPILTDKADIQTAQYNDPNFLVRSSDQRVCITHRSWVTTPGFNREEESRNFKRTLSSSETAVNLPSWWSYKAAAASWEIPPVFLHLDPSPLTRTFKDAWKTLWWSSIVAATVPQSHVQQLRRGLLWETHTHTSTCERRTDSMKLFWEMSGSHDVP